MARHPSILTNMAFRQSRVWSEAVTSICREAESPDNLCPLRQAVRLFRRRSHYDVVVTMGPRPSLAYGLLCALFRVPSRQILTEVFLDSPRPGSPAWRLKTAWLRLAARRSYGVLTNSSGEVRLIADRLGLPDSRLRFVPMYSTIPDPGMRETNDGSVVSIGRTLRDLDTLARAARDIQAPIRIVAGGHDRVPDDLPENIRVLRDLPLDSTYELLAKAAVVVLPLLPAERSTGQVVMFEAMAMGKPVVATRCIGTTDYIRHSENGWLVNPGDALGLAQAVNHLLRAPGEARRLGKQALQDCLSQWMPDHHASHKLQAVEDLSRLPLEDRSTS